MREPHFAAFSRRLASSARLILFDKRGTGLSDQVPRLSPTLEEWMNHVQAVNAARWHAGDCDLSVQGLDTGCTVEVAEELIAYAPLGPIVVSRVTKNLVARSRIEFEQVAAVYGEG